MIIPHKRPLRFSDPFHDFDEVSLRELIETPDSEMTGCHYQQILGPFLPAGTYEESVYFLPAAFDWLVANSGDSLDLVTPVIWFCSEYCSDLQRDGALDSCRQRLSACLSEWTCRFEVRHFDAADCAAKGWRRTYFDYVLMSETLCEATSDLVRFETHADIAFDFYRHLSSSCASVSEAAWHLDLAAAYTRQEIYSPPSDDRVVTPLTDRNSILSASAIVSAALPTFSRDQSYWQDTFKALGLVM